MNKKLVALLVAGSTITACSDNTSGPSAPPEPLVVLCEGSEANPSRLFLQQLGTDQVIIKWRGNADGGDDPDRVCFGRDMSALEASSETVVSVTATGHSEALLTGLEADTTYYYSVGGAGTANSARSFHTAPADNATPSDWTIVIFHHPPYTKGSHDSDEILIGIDQPIFDMREEFTPVFDAYGVDLVYGGHSHIYERSYYINGHTGLSGSFDPQVHAELNDAGEPASGRGDETYTQISRNGTDDKVVYTVAGNGGKITTTSDGFPHPAHFFSELTLGSVVIDINEDTLEASFVDDNGDVQDSFVITRSGS